MNREMRIIREVSIQAENFYEDAVKIGDHAAFALKAAHRSQISSLESIAESTFKTSDVFDYIKKQIARFPYWRQPFAEHTDTAIGFGERLKSYLENDLPKKLGIICKHLSIGNTTDEEKQERRRIYLLLIRQFIRQMATEYEYQVSPGEKKKGGLKAMLSTAQLQKIWLLSDTVLYPEAVFFMRKLVREQECNPLPTSQVSGLLSIAASHKYDELSRYVRHQRERDWPPSRSDLKTFYTALEEVLSLMQRKRLKEEFHLLTEQRGRSVSDIRQEADELMATLAREFIQHLLAENGVLGAQKANERTQQKTSRR